MKSLNAKHNIMKRNKPDFSATTIDTSPNIYEYNPQNNKTNIKYWSSNSDSDQSQPGTADEEMLPLSTADHATLSLSPSQMTPPLSPVLPIQDEEPALSCRDHVKGNLYRWGNIFVKMILWGSAFTLFGGVVWYSLELRRNGTDPHLIAWFSAGAFVLTSFPISMYGIILHLVHYYNPEVQIYVIRIVSQSVSQPVSQSVSDMLH